MNIKFFHWLLMIAVFAVSTVEAKTAWELSKKDDGIEVYTRDTPNSKLEAFRGVMTISTRLSSIAAVLEDTKVFPQLFHQCKSAQLLKSKKTGDHEYYNRIVTGMPWPVNPRDSITQSIVSQDKKTKRINISINSKPNMVPEKAGIVRVKHLVGRWELTPLKGGKVRVVYELSIIAGGNIPTWLVNLLIVDSPYFTLLNLSNLVKKPAYKNAKLSHIID